SRMKAEMAVRSISASISACAARIAPRTISRVTGSQAPAVEFLLARLSMRSVWGGTAALSIAGRHGLHSASRRFAGMLLAIHRMAVLERLAFVGAIEWLGFQSMAVSEREAVGDRRNSPSAMGT